AVRDLPLAKRAAEIAYGVLDAALRLPSQLLQNLLRRDVIRPQVVARRRHDRDGRLLRELLLDYALDLFGKLRDREVLVAGVERLTGNLPGGPLDQIRIETGHVVDVDVRPLLRAAEHRNLSLVDRMIREDVDGQVEAQARRVAAHRRRPDDDGRKRGRLILEQQRLGHPLETVVERQRNERMLLGDLRRIADAVDGARRRTDEALDPGLDGRLHAALEAVVVNRLAQRLVELEARVVGDAREMNDRVHTLHRRLERRDVADVALDHREARIRFRQMIVAKQHPVV